MVFNGFQWFSSWVGWVCTHKKLQEEPQTRFSMVLVFGFTVDLKKPEFLDGLMVFEVLFHWFFHYFKNRLAKLGFSHFTTVLPFWDLFQASPWGWVGFAQKDAGDQTETVFLTLWGPKPYPAVQRGVELRWFELMGLVCFLVIWRRRWVNKKTPTGTTGFGLFVLLQNWGFLGALF